MKNVKRMVAFMMVMLTLTGTTANLKAYAQEKTEGVVELATEFMNAVNSAPEEYGFDAKMLSDVYLSNALPVYSSGENGDLYLAEGKHCFLLYQGTTCIALISTKIEDNVVKSAFFETKTPDIINERGYKEVTLVSHDMGISVEQTSYDAEITVLAELELNEKMSRIPSGYGVSIPIVRQGNNELCWSACVSAVGKYNML